MEKEPTEITFSAEAAEKGGFEHFMMKEIHEQPKAIQDTLNSVIHDGRIDLSPVGLTDEEIREVSQLYMVACGSAWHVGMVAQYVFEDLARLPVRVSWPPNSVTAICRWTREGWWSSSARAGRQQIVWPPCGKQKPGGSGRWPSSMCGQQHCPGGRPCLLHPGRP